MKDLLKREANAGDPYACLAMAYYCQTGKEFDQNIPLAVRWYEKAAKGNCPRANWELAKFYRDGGFVTRDLSQYTFHLIKAAELGNADAQMALGIEYWTGYILEKDEASAYRWMRRSADQGSSRAKFYTGYMCSHGIGVDRSLAEAENWYSSSALTGDGDMFLDIGMGYEFGTDLYETDMSEAARWYKYGVDMGHERCTICWNSLLPSLENGEQDTLDIRLHKLRCSDSQKEIDARSFALATADEFFEAGDAEGALSYYEEAAGLGSPEAMFTIAMMHHQGIAVRRDDGVAIRMLSRAAKAGSEDAQFYLAQAYENGTIHNDEAEVIKLYADAASNGFLAAFYYLSNYVDHPERYVRRTHPRR